jgi:DNA-binding CsgD family transcriptional regulator
LAALVPAARGHWERAAAHVGAAYDSMPRAEGLAALGYAASADAHLATARGDARAVATALRPLLGLGVRDGIDEPGVVPWHDLLVDALVMLGEHVQAEAALISFERLAADRRRYSAQAAASRARGNLHGALREPERALAAFETGLELAAKVAMPFERARLELAYGAFLRRLGKRSAAAERLEAAQVGFQALAASPYLERCERELAGCGRNPVQRRDSGGTSLTPQELAVARLVADGLTNRQMARELVVSVKTIEYHLSKVYSKLGVRSRAQLTARLLTH